MAHNYLYNMYKKYSAFTSHVFSRKRRVYPFPEDHVRTRMELERDAVMLLNDEAA